MSSILSQAMLYMWFISRTWVEHVDRADTHGGPQGVRADNEHERDQTDLPVRLRVQGRRSCGQEVG